jgi:hypothetical protein
VAAAESVERQSNAQSLHGVEAAEHLRFFHQNRFRQRHDHPGRDPRPRSEMGGQHGQPFPVA